MPVVIRLPGRTTCIGAILLCAKQYGTLVEKISVYMSMSKFRFLSALIDFSRFE